MLTLQLGRSIRGRGDDYRHAIMPNPTKIAVNLVLWLPFWMRASACRFAIGTDARALSRDSLVMQLSAKLVSPILEPPLSLAC